VVAGAVVAGAVVAGAVVAGASSVVEVMVVACGGAPVVDADSDVAVHADATSASVRIAP
jgi:hypothetical protein